MLMCHEREVTCVTKKEANNMPMTAWTECHVSLLDSARCHDRRVCHTSTLMTATYSLKSTTEISFGSPGSGKMKTQTYFFLEEKHLELRI
jgi:hypothetical protein